MVGIHERDEVWVIRVIVFDQDTLVLQPYDSDAVAEVLCERPNCETKGRSGTLMLPRRKCLAPVERVDRPCK